jgi:hypothetical protein
MNQHQITMTRGDDRTFILTVDDEWEGASARFLVDRLFTKTGLEVGEDDGSGSSVVTVTIDSADTEDSPNHRRAYRYELELTLLGDVRTVLSGLFVVRPDLDAM